MAQWCDGRASPIMEAMLQSRRPLLIAIGVAAIVLSLALGACMIVRVGSPAPSAATLIFAEFGPSADLVFTAPATDPARRTQVLTIDHATGWGISATAQAVRGLVAFNLLPPQARGEANTPAELWLLDVAAKTKRLIASDADLRVAPVLTADGAVLLYRSSASGGQQSIVQVDVASGTRRVVHTVETAFGVFPVGIDSDRTVIFISLGTQGTDIYRIAEGRAPTLIVHASDQIARDWRLSPDGRLLSCLAPEVQAERVVHRVHVVELRTGAALRGVDVDPEKGAEQFSPAWMPDGRALTVGRAPVGGAPRSGALSLSLAAGPAALLIGPDRGFDAPLAWSPDAGYLATKTFSGASSALPGAESVVVVSTHGRRYVVSGAGEIIVLGWMPQ